MIIKNDIKKDPNNKTILFSPAAASFDQFKNFEHRGNYFNSLIKKINFYGNKSYYNNFIYDWWKNLDKVILFYLCY